MTEFHAGDVVGGYRLEARLGGGGFGTVWRARHVDTGRMVAIKLLPEIDAGSEEARLAADIELLAASAASRSEHIVHVLEGGIQPVPYVVMEFISGSSLADELRERRILTPLETVEIGLGIADALKALNDVGIIHRDVKPSNVMIDRDGLVKLTDFGIAKIVGYDTKTQTGDMRLSMAYAAPEVWEGRAEHRSDLYSLGIVLYQCLRGALPFRGGYAELFYQHRSIQPNLEQLPEGLPATLEQLIGDCLQKEPAARPRSAASCIPMLQKAKAELEAAPQRPEVKEPDRFGQWIIQDDHPDRDWAWLCKHERTGEPAVVDLFFAESAAYGDELRRAVAANRQLAPLGAERLIETNRFILRPGETWVGAPPDAFQFWLARQEVEPPEAPIVMTPLLLLRAVEALMALIGAARTAGIALDLKEGRLAIYDDGGILVRDPGLVPEPPEGPEVQALEFLRDLPLTRELRPIVFRSSRLDDIRRALAALIAVRETLPARPGDTAIATRPRSLQANLPFIGAGIAGALIVAVLTWLLVISNPDPGTPDEAAAPTVIPRPEALMACMALELPVPLARFESTCGSLEPAYTQDPACPRGTACTRIDGIDGIAAGINSRTLAYVDGSGNLSMAATDGAEVAQLTGHGSARYPAWSPDGRYLAYVQVQRLTGPFERYSTQLRVIEADRRGNDGIVLASIGAESEPEWQRRYVMAPQWSPDGRSLYFLWATADGGSAGLFSVDLPLTGRGSEIDFGELRTAAPSDQSMLTDRIANLHLSASDFGVNEGILGRFLVDQGGAMFVQVCDGPHDRRRCGLGRWDGQSRLIAPLENDVAYGVPAQIPGASELVVSRWKRNEGWRLYPITRAGARAGDKEITVPAPADELGFPVPRFTVIDDGETIIFETSAGDLSLVSSEGGQASPLAKGRAPVEYLLAGATTPIGAQLDRSPYATPTLTPTPTATPRPTFVPMTLLVTVRRGAMTLPGVEVFAYVGNNDCASARTDTIGRVTISFPREGAPAACGVAGSTIRFGIERDLVPTTVLYAPQTVASVELILP